MTRIILSGCNGHMGRVISSCAAARENCKIVAGVDLCTDQNFDYPVYANIFEYTGGADVIIDFSHPSALENLLKYAVTMNMPAVIATTGLTPEQVESLKQAAEKVPVFFSANMSLGVNLMAELCKKAAAVLGSDFDIEIIEKHHNQKIDAPSGTALMLADEIASVTPYQAYYEYDRHARRKKRDKNEIGIHAVRGGTIVGEHEVIFAGRDEIVTISHSARSKEIFAVGCLNAGIFLADCEPGLYNMGHLIQKA